MPRFPRLLARTVLFVGFAANALLMAANIGTRCYPVAILGAIASLWCYGEMINFPPTEEESS